jgi:hypothetical protein
MTTSTTTTPDVTSKFDWSWEANLVHIDGKPMFVCGQGWGIAILHDKSAGDYVMCVDVYMTCHRANQHRLSCNVTDGARLLAHWKGYVENTKEKYNLK